MSYYDRQGRPIDFDRWGALFEQMDYKRVGYDVCPDQFDDQLEQVLEDGPIAAVSTVWLGINHAFGFGGPPIIFETMIFGGPYAEEMMRYSTEADALEGHRRVVEDLRAGRAPWWLESDMEIHNQEGNDGGQEGHSGR